MWHILGRTSQILKCYSTGLRALKFRVSLGQKFVYLKLLITLTIWWIRGATVDHQRHLKLQVTPGSHLAWSPYCQKETNVPWFLWPRQKAFALAIRTGVSETITDGIRNANNFPSPHYMSCQDSTPCLIIHKQDNYHHLTKYTSGVTEIPDTLQLNNENSLNDM